MLEFGAKDALTKLVETKLEDKDGKPLWITNRVKMYCFIGGVYAHEEGLVLSSNTDEGYYPMPSTEEIKALQGEGMMPNPLPPARMGFMDYLGGYLLWWVILFVVIFERIKKTFFRKKAPVEPLPEPTTSEATVDGTSHENDEEEQDV